MARCVTRTMLRGGMAPSHDCHRPRSRPAGRRLAHDGFARRQRQRPRATRNQAGRRARDRCRPLRAQWIGAGADVQGDSVGGARRLVEHLISLGHRRIAMIAEAVSVSTARERRRGYEEALALAGIAHEPQLLLETSVDLPGGYRAMQTLLRLEPRP